MAARSVSLGLELRAFSGSESYVHEGWSWRGGSSASLRGVNGVCCCSLSTSSTEERSGMKGRRREVRSSVSVPLRKLRLSSATAQRQQLIHDNEDEKVAGMREFEVSGLHADLHTSSSYSHAADELEPEVLGEGRDESPPRESGVSSLEESQNPLPLPPLREGGEGAVDFGIDKDTSSSSVGLRVGGLVAAAFVLLAVGGVGGAGYLYRDELNGLIGHVNEYIEGYGAFGYLIFVLAYAGLEVVAIPAIPLTMTAGLLFGNLVGTVLVSIAGTIAATVAFLIARYVARDRLLLLAKDNKQFMAIDKAIGDDGFRVVTLLRLSPLLPFSLGNYLYGLTSVDLVPYVAGSWLGMLPGTWAYVSAGALSRSLLADDGPAAAVVPSNLTIVIGLTATVGVAWYITRLAKEALEKVKDD